MVTRTYNPQEDVSDDRIPSSGTKTNRELTCQRCSQRMTQAQSRTTLLDEAYIYLPEHPSLLGFRQRMHIHPLTWTHGGAVARLRVIPGYGYLKSVYIFVGGRAESNNAAVGWTQ